MARRYFNTSKRYFGYGAGAAAGTGVLAVEDGIAGAIQQTTLKFTDLVVTVANTTGASFGSQKIYDFPQGRIHLLGGRANLTLNWAGTDIAAAGSGDFSLGTTATADATLGGTDVDLMASTALLDPFVLGIGTGKGNLVTSTAFDGTATAIDMFLNIIIDDADVDDADTDPVTIDGTITFSWINYGL
jgi:hypothetical protein